MKGLERKLEQYSSLTVEQENRTMKAIELGLTVRQADLIIEALRLKLRDNNDQLNNFVLSGEDELIMRSNNEVIRSTMLVLKDQIHSVAK